jgi:hypothetical protein
MAQIAMQPLVMASDKSNAITNARWVI